LKKFTSPYVSILLLIVLPVEPVCPVIPFEPISLAWSQAAFYNESSNTNAGNGYYTYKNLISSWIALGPSLVVRPTLLPGKYIVFPLKYVNIFSNSGI